MISMFMFQPPTKTGVNSPLAFAATSTTSAPTSRIRPLRDLQLNPCARVNRDLSTLNRDIASSSFFFFLPEMNRGFLVTCERKMGEEGTLR